MSPAWFSRPHLLVPFTKDSQPYLLYLRPIVPAASYVTNLFVYSLKRLYQQLPQATATLFDYLATNEIFSVLFTWQRTNLLFIHISSPLAALANDTFGTSVKHVFLFLLAQSASHIPSLSIHTRLPKYPTRPSPPPQRCRPLPLLLRWNLRFKNSKAHRTILHGRPLWQSY